MQIKYELYFFLNIGNFLSIFLILQNLLLKFKFTKFIIKIILINKEDKNKNPHFHAKYLKSSTLTLNSSITTATI